MKSKYFVLIFSLALAGCRGGIGGSTIVGEAPSMFIAAPKEKVQHIVIARAAAKGSIIKASGNDLVLERPLLGKGSPEVEAACGSSWFNRKVRVVMTLQNVQGGGTQMTERRYISGGSPLSRGPCALPLSSDDYAQSLGAMSAVKVEAEAGAAPPKAQ